MEVVEFDRGSLLRVTISLGEVTWGVKGAIRKYLQ